jgi:hypothetical protein
VTETRAKVLTILLAIGIFAQVAAAVGLVVLWSGRCVP